MSLNQLETEKYMFFSEKIVSFILLMKNLDPNPDPELDPDLY